MSNSKQTQRNLFLTFVGLITLVATIVLTYIGDILSSFRGSELVYLGWLMLAGSVVCGLLVLQRPSSRTCIMFRNVTLTLGFLIICLAVILLITIEGMMPF